MTSRGTQGSRKTPRGQVPDGVGSIRYAAAGEIEANGTPPDFTPPTPVRPLNARGHEWWDWVWRAGATWLHPVVDREMVQIVAEMVDERELLRARVMSPDDWRDWRERSQLRTLDKQLRDAMGELGLNPVDRARMLVNPSKTSALDELMLKRQAKGNTPAADSG